MGMLILTIAFVVHYIVTFSYLIRVLQGRLQLASLHLKKLNDKTILNNRST